MFEYDGTDFRIDHFKVGISLYSFLISQIYLDNVVSFECLNKFVWLLYLFLKSPSAVPRYVSSGFIDVDGTHLSTMSCARHCPFNGH